MTGWTCPACGEAGETGFDLCWRCGTHADGRPPAGDFVREDAPAAAPVAPAARDLACLRCAQPMRPLGPRAFHEGSVARAVLLGELFTRREGFDLYACGACGKVEFFLPPDAA